MSLPATRFALSYVGTAGNQGSHLAACADPKVRGLFRCRQFDHRSVRTHDVPHLQRRNIPELPQADAASKESRTTHDPRARQRPLSSRTPLGRVFASPCSGSATAVSTALQSATCPDRASLETHPSLGDTQPLLRNPSRSAESCQRVLRSLAPTEQSAAPTMLHYLGRCV